MLLNIHFALFLEQVVLTFLTYFYLVSFLSEINGTKFLHNVQCWQQERAWLCPIKNVFRLWLKFKMIVFCIIIN